jgi:hypothetical protein
MAVAELGPSTRNTYEGYICRTLLPAFGSMELRKVRGPLLDTFAALRSAGTADQAGPLAASRPPPGAQSGRCPRL